MVIQHGDVELLGHRFLKAILATNVGSFPAPMTA